jgi:hypothetical protein
MTKTVQIQFPKNGCRALSKEARARSGSRPVLNRTVKKVSRPVMGFLYLGMSGVTESTSLAVILVRFLFSLVRWLLVAAKPSPQIKKLPTRTPLGEMAPLEGDHGKSERRVATGVSTRKWVFRRAWAQPSPDPALHSKNLMRMTHQSLQ